MFLNRLLQHDMEEEDRSQWLLHTEDSRESPEEVFIFRSTSPGRNMSDNIYFGSVPRVCLTYAVFFFQMDSKKKHANEGICWAYLFFWLTPLGPSDCKQSSKVPLKFYGPDSMSFFQGASIFVLKRHTSLGFLLFKSYVLRQPPV